MKKCFPDEQIISILREAEAGVRPNNRTRSMERVRTSESKKPAIGGFF